MSLSVLYHALGIYGYHHLKTESQGGAIYLYMVRAKNLCGFCQSWKVIGKGYCWRRLRTLPIGRKPVFAVVRMRRSCCEDCRRIRYEDLIIADRRKHYTHALETYVMDLCARMTIRDVAEHIRLHWEMVKNIDSKRLKRHRIRPRAIALDMWKPYARAIKRHYRGLPLVYDVFHILSDYSRTLNEIRVDEYKKLEGQEEGRFIKGSRHLLLKGQEKLSIPAQEKLLQLLSMNRPLFIAYVLKEDLRRLWRLPTRREAERYLYDWIHKALSSGISLLSRFARKLKRHAAGILNYFDFPISTAKVEGINNRIKVIKRRAYGYRDMDYFKLKIYNIHTTRYSKT